MCCLHYTIVICIQRVPKFHVYVNPADFFVILSSSAIKKTLAQIFLSLTRWGFYSITLLCEMPLRYFGHKKWRRTGILPHFKDDLYLKNYFNSEIIIAQVIL